MTSARVEIKLLIIKHGMQNIIQIDDVKLVDISFQPGTNPFEIEENHEQVCIKNGTRYKTNDACMIH